MLLARRRLPDGTLRRFGLSRHQIFRHRHHPQDYTTTHLSFERLQQLQASAARLWRWKWQAGGEES